jgi:hypothetical protein
MEMLMNHLTDLTREANRVIIPCPSQKEYDSLPQTDKDALYPTLNDYHIWLQSVSDWDTGYYGTDERYVGVVDDDGLTGLDKK